VTGGGTHLGGAAIEFVKVVGMGVVIGGVIAGAASFVMHRLDEPMIEIAITTIAAYGSFVAAEQLHFSGVIATVTAGMVCGNIAAPRAMTPSTRIAVESFWEYVAFALNSLVFLLIGIEVPIERLVRAWHVILIAFVAVTIGRAAVVFLASALLRGTKERIPWQWSVMLTWGGLRGALSMVLALALPAALPHRDIIVTMTFGVVLISIVLQGLTAGPLLRVLKIVTQSKDQPRPRALA
jgi:CPA1 family monovalent cation:H+ antiporter